MSQNLIVEKSYSFAVEVTNFVLKIQHDQKEFVLTKQLLRSSTSIVANISEAQFAQSKADFIHKLYISLKEANETKFWLKLLQDSELKINTHKLLDKVESLISLLVRIIKSSKRKS